MAPWIVSEGLFYTCVSARQRAVLGCQGQEEGESFREQHVCELLASGAHHPSMFPLSRVDLWLVLSHYLGSALMSPSAGGLLPLPQAATTLAAKLPCWLIFLQ